MKLKNIFIPENYKSLLDELDTLIKKINKKIPELTAVINKYDLCYLPIKMKLQKQVKRLIKDNGFMEIKLKTLKSLEEEFTANEKLFANREWLPMLKKYRELMKREYKLLKKCIRTLKTRLFLAKFFGVKVILKDDESNNSS